jgi:hypothetical protein
LLSHSAEFALAEPFEHRLPSGELIGMAGTITLSRMPEGVSPEQWLAYAYERCRRRAMVVAVRLAGPGLLTIN